MNHDAAAQGMPGAWEVGRLVLAPEFRAGPDQLKRCLFLTLEHLVDTTDIGNLFASCTALLSRLYRRFGFTVLVKDAAIGPEGTYSLIHGEVPTVFRALAGSDPERDAVERRLGSHRPH